MNKITLAASFSDYQESFKEGQLLDHEKTSSLPCLEDIPFEDLILEVVKNKGLSNEENEIDGEKTKELQLPDLDPASINLIEKHPSHLKFFPIIENIWQAIPKRNDSHELHWIGGEVRDVLQAVFLRKALLKLWQFCGGGEFFIDQENDNYPLQLDTDYKVTFYKDQFETLEKMNDTAKKVVEANPLFQWGIVSACDESSCNSYITTNIKYQNEHNLDLALVRGYTRHHLFTRDALGIRLRKGEKKEIQVIFQGQNPWQVILDNYAKLIHIDQIETLNHMGLPRAWNLLARGYRFTNSHDSPILYDKIKEKNKKVEELILKSHKNHDGGDGEALIYTFLCSYEELRKNSASPDFIWNYLNKESSFLNGKQNFSLHLRNSLNINPIQSTWVGLQLFSLLSLSMGTQNQIELKISHNYGKPYLKLKYKYVAWIPLNLDQLFNDMLSLDPDQIKGPEEFYQILEDLAFSGQSKKTGILEKKRNKVTVESEITLSTRVTASYHKESNSWKKWLLYLFVMVLEALFPERNKRLFLLYEFIHVADCFKKVEHQINVLKHLQNQEVHSQYFFDVARQILLGSPNSADLKNWWRWQCQNIQIPLDLQWKIYEDLLEIYPAEALKIFERALYEDKIPSTHAIKCLDRFTLTSLKGDWDKLAVYVLNKVFRKEGLEFIKAHDTIVEDSPDRKNLLSHPFFCYLREGEILRGEDFALLHLLALLKDASKLPLKYGLSQKPLSGLFRHIKIIFPPKSLGDLYSYLKDCVLAEAIKKLSFLENFLAEIDLEDSRIISLSEQSDTPELFNLFQTAYSRAALDQKIIIYLLVYVLRHQVRNAKIESFLIKESFLFLSSAPSKPLKILICTGLQGIFPHLTSHFEASKYFIKQSSDSSLQYLWKNHLNPQKLLPKERWVLVKDLACFNKEASWRQYLELLNQISCQKGALAAPSKEDLHSYFPTYFEEIDFEQLNKVATSFLNQAKKSQYESLSCLLLGFFQKGMAIKKIEAIFTHLPIILNLKAEGFYTLPYLEVWLNLGHELCMVDLGLAIEFWKLGKKFLFGQNGSVEKNIRSFYYHLYSQIFSEEKEQHYQDVIAHIQNEFKTEKQKTYKNTILLNFSHDLNKGLIGFHYHLKEKNLNALDMNELVKKAWERVKEEELSFFQTRMLGMCLKEYLLKCTQKDIQAKELLKNGVLKICSSIPQKDLFSLIEGLQVAISEKNFDKKIGEEIFFAAFQQGIIKKEYKLSGKIWQIAAKNKIWNQFLSKDDYHLHLLKLYGGIEDAVLKEEILRDLKLEKCSDDPQILSLIPAKVLSLLPDSIKSAKNLWVKYRAQLKIEDSLFLLQKVSTASLAMQQMTLFQETFKEWVSLVVGKETKENALKFVKVFINSQLENLEQDRHFESLILFFLSKSLKNYLSSEESMHYAILCLNIWKRKVSLAANFNKAIEKIVLKISQENIFSPASFLIFHTILFDLFNESESPDQLLLALIKEHVSYFIKEYDQKGYYEEMLKFLSIFKIMPGTFEITAVDFLKISNAYEICLARIPDKLAVLKDIHYFFVSLRRNISLAKMVPLQANFAFSILEKTISSHARGLANLEFRSGVIARIDDVLSYENLLPKEKQTVLHLQYCIDYTLKLLDEDTLGSILSLLNRFSPLFLNYAIRENLMIRLSLMHSYLCEELKLCYRKNVFEELLCLFANYQFIYAEPWIELLKFFDEKDFYISQPLSGLYLSILNSPNSQITSEQNFQIMAHTIKIYTKSQNPIFFVICNNLTHYANIPKERIEGYVTLIIDCIKEFPGFPCLTLKGFWENTLSLGWLTEENENKFMLLFISFFKHKDAALLDIFLNQLLIPHLKKTSSSKQSFELINRIFKKVREYYDNQTSHQFLQNLREGMKLSGLSVKQLEDLLNQLSQTIPLDESFSESHFEDKLLELYGEKFDQKKLIEKGSEIFDNVVLLLKKGSHRLFNQEKINKHLYKLNQDLISINFFPTKDQFFQLLFAIFNNENEIAVAIGGRWLGRILQKEYLKTLSKPERQVLFEFIKSLLKNKQYKTHVNNFFDYSTSILQACQAFFTQDEFETLKIFDHLILLLEGIQERKENSAKLKLFYAKKPETCTSKIQIKYLSLLKDIRPDSFCDYLEMSLHLFSLLFGKEEDQLRAFPTSFLKIALDNKEVFTEDFIHMTEERKIWEKHWREGACLTIAGASQEKKSLKGKLQNQFKKISFSQNWITNTTQWIDHLSKWLINWIEHCDEFSPEEHRVIIFGGLYFLNLFSEIYASQSNLREEEIKNYFELWERFIFSKLNQKYPSLDKMIILHAQDMLKQLEGNSKLFRFKSCPWFIVFYRYFRLEQKDPLCFKMMPNREALSSRVNFLTYERLLKWTAHLNVIDSACFSSLFNKNCPYYELLTPDNRFYLFEQGLAHLKNNPFTAMQAMNGYQYIPIATFFAEIVSLVEDPARSFYQEIFLKSLLEAYQIYPCYNLFAFTMDKFKEYFFHKMEEEDRQLFFKKMIDCFSARFSSISLETQKKILGQIAIMVNSFPENVQKKEAIQAVLKQTIK